MLQAVPTPPSESPAPIAALDPGWLFLIAGIGLLASTVLLPAFDELADVALQRDRVLQLEAHRLDRLDRYAAYETALDREEPSLVIALAQSQLNQIPANRSLLLETPDPATSNASVFPALEPPPLKLVTATKDPSLLERLATGNRTRPWLLAAGCLCLLLGLLPRATVRGCGLLRPSSPA